MEQMWDTNRSSARQLSFITAFTTARHLSPSSHF